MAARPLPNIILLMCDDLGYGDTGFNGNTTIRTPHLDALATEGARFTRFYAGGPVCSPTRATCLTGRHYSRYGIVHANKGSLRSEEITLAEACRTRGYRTGHFGKWHLGTLTASRADGNRGGPAARHHYAPPQNHGFDTCFSTEAKVPTWDPMITPDEAGPNGQRWGVPGTAFGTAYWNEKGERVEENLAGCDSRVMVDRAAPFIRACVAAGSPFLAVIWFHAPHTPVVAGPEYRALYANCCEEEQHYYGCITAMDEQVGRINRLIKKLNCEENTILWFCSDNGPEGGEELSANGRSRGVTGGLRGRKRSLYSGGIAVPALVKWPSMIKAGSEITAPASTLDYFPTLIRHIGFDMPDPRPLDGMDLTAILRGESDARGKPIPYRFLERKHAMFGSPTIALLDDRYKFLTNLSTEGAEDQLFDLVEDREETRNLAADKPGMASAMRQRLQDFMTSCRHSHFGGDYPEGFSTDAAFQDVSGTWAG